MRGRWRSMPKRRGGIIINELSYYEYGGVLSDVDIINAVKAGDIFIAPYDSQQLQPSGYNLTPTRFFYSTKKKKLLTVIENEDEAYVIIDKNDSVLVRTRESIAIASHLTGAFYSKVKVVSQGFGHVSTTLDPNWEGQLLISLNNPTNKKLKFSIEKNVYGKKVYNSFVTVEFLFLNLPSNKIADNITGRLDILDETIERNISVFKRGKVELLYQLVRKLHEQEKINMESIIISMLDTGEKELWKQILMIQDDKNFRIQKSDFLRKKQIKYLRLIQNRFEKNALENIEIVNQYIHNKQKYAPIRYKILKLIMNNLYLIISVGIVAVLLMALIGSAMASNVMQQGENGSISLYTIVSGIVLSVLPVIIQKIVEYYQIK